MRSAIEKLLKNKSILLLGFGKEGQASYDLLRELFPDAKLGIADKNEKLLLDDGPLLEDANLYLHTGLEYLHACTQYDLIIKSPGISYDLVTSYCDDQKISSQTDLFLQAYSERVIGVTGTKGKSTTSTLIYHILKHSGRKVVLTGNIGIPPLSLVKEIDDGLLIVFEMSSHQLEHIKRSPQTAVILNVYPEHLDHYQDFTAYKMAKFNIHHMQGQGSLLVYNADDPLISDLSRPYQEGIAYRSFSRDPQSAADATLTEKGIEVKIHGRPDLFFPVDSIADLPGKHNLMNLMAAMLVCIEKGVDPDQILEALESYKRPEHRLEFAGVYKGIKFYNDSIATIPEAVIEALNTLPDVNMLILGGYDRMLDYSSLYKRLETDSIPYLVFMGDAGKRMFSEAGTELSRHSSCYNVNTFERVFEIVSDKLKSGDLCLLSPAAASYGMFRDFEERGEVYKKMAAAL